MSKRNFKKILGSTLLIGCLTMVSGIFVSAATYEGYTQEEFDALTETTVIRSEDSPTGYYVTFRYQDPDASRVCIYGEWAFSDIDHSSIVISLNATPEEWQDGYTVWQTKGWPTADMTLNEETGVWSYTIPLPNGTWCYRYYVGGTEGAELTDYTDAVLVADPANSNYVANPEEYSGEQMLTSVYAPYDEVKQANTTCVVEQVPRDGENGTVLFETATSSGGIETTYGIYLPHMTEEYNASDDPSRRALAGLSQGGACIMYGYFNCTEAFDYYISMSAPMRGNVYPDFEKEELKDVNLFIGFGLYDHVATRAFYNEAIAANESSTYPLRVYFCVISMKDCVPLM